MQQGPVLVCVSADLSGESDGLGVPAFNRFVMQSAFNKVSPLNCRSSIHSALISISRPEKLLNKGLSQGQRENCSSLRAHISLLPLDLFFTAMIYRMTRSSSVLAQSLLKCGEKPESLTHLDKRSSPFGRLSQVKPLECSISRKKRQKVILRRRFGFLTFNKCTTRSIVKRYLL